MILLFHRRSRGRSRRALDGGLPTRGGSAGEVRLPGPGEDAADLLGRLSGGVILLAANGRTAAPDSLVLAAIDRLGPAGRPLLRSFEMWLRASGGWLALHRPTGGLPAGIARVACMGIGFAITRGRTCPAPLRRPAENVSEARISFAGAAVDAPTSGRGVPGRRGGATRRLVGGAVHPPGPWLLTRQEARPPSAGDPLDAAG